MKKDCITLELPHRTFVELEQYANSMGISVSDYARKLVEDGYYIEKFGDINKILNKGEVQTIKENESQKTVETEAAKQVEVEVDTQTEAEDPNIALSDEKMQTNVKTNTVKTVRRRQIKAK